MSLQNLLGGLALDTTLGELIELLGQDPDAPFFVATDPDGLPVEVTGEVQIVGADAQNAILSLLAKDASLALLAKDSTLQGVAKDASLALLLTALIGGLDDLTELMRADDNERPQFVATDPDGLPVDVVGEVLAIDDKANILGGTQYTSASFALGTYNKIADVNPSRKNLSINNNAGPTAGATDFFVGGYAADGTRVTIVCLQNGDYFELPRPMYTGALWAYVQTTLGSFRVAEFS